jgi:hypothetical protein
LLQSNIPRKIEIEKVIGSPDMKMRINNSSLSLGKQESNQNVASKPINIGIYRSGNINDLGHTSTLSSSMNHYPRPQRKEVEQKTDSTSVPHQTIIE